jgi:hypothetical protein
VTRALLLALLALTLPAPAHALDLQLGIEDEEGCKYQPQTALARADTVNAGTVRILIPRGRWQAEQDAYVACAARAKASGRRVLAALVSYGHGRPTAAEWHDFAAQAVPRLDPYVDVWSPMNEPNLPSMAPLTETVCRTVTTRRTSSRTETVAPARSGWKRVKPRTGTHRKTVRRRHGRKIVRYRPARGRRARWIKTTTAATTRVVYTTTEHAARVCNAEARGAAYRRVWDAVTPLMAHKPLILGDLCPGPQAEFIDAFYQPGPPTVRPSIMAGHPYNGVTEARETVQIARELGLRAWLTEWGRFAPRNAPEDWTRSLEAFAEAGAELVVLYDVRSPQHPMPGTLAGFWDTRMSDGALAAVGGL